MPFSPIPRGVYPSVTSLRPKDLADRGIRLVLADLDNTLVPYKVTQPPQAIVDWKEELEAAGIQLFLLSNSRKPGRAQNFAEKLGITCGPWSAWAAPPRRPSWWGTRSSPTP